MSEIEKVNGVWQGIPCNIRKVWGKNEEWEGHEFTPDEQTALFNNETIEFDAISKAGKPYKAKGKLEKITKTDNDGKEYSYVGFQLKFDEKPIVEKFEGTWNNQKVRVTRSWGGHRFTDEEVKKLLNGETIEFEAVSKANSKYTAKGKLEKKFFSDGGIEREYVGFALIFD